MNLKEFLFAALTQKLAKNFQKPPIKLQEFNSANKFVTYKLSVLLLHNLIHLKPMYITICR